MADTSVTLHRIRFRNPVLPAAGPNVRTGAMMAAAAAGGAGGIVSKTVSVRPASDPRPTIRRSGNGGLLNSETWSEVPLESYLEELAVAKGTGLPLVVSIGYRPEEVARLGEIIERMVSPDAFEFSTHYSGTDVAPLVEVAQSLRAVVRSPVWMKVSPSVANVRALAEAVSPYVDGFVAINSYGPVLDFDPENPVPLLGSPDGTGWLSGPPIRPIALRIVHELSRSQDKPVIGVGGITNGREAVQFFMAGAHLVQVCTAAIRSGHAVYGRIAAEIDAWLDSHGFASIEEIRGRYPAGPAAVRRAEAGAAATPVGTIVMAVDPQKCTGCEACIGSCVHGALRMEGGVAVVDPAACIGCGLCSDSCRFAAMMLEEVPA